MLRRYHKIGRLVGDKSYVVAYDIVLHTEFLCSDKEWQLMCLTQCNREEEKILALRWWERRGK
jgi:hypothetical protein